MITTMVFRSGVSISLPYEVYIDPAIILDERTKTYRIVLIAGKNAEVIDRNMKEKGWIGDVILQNDTHEIEIKLAAVDKHKIENETMYELDMDLTPESHIYRKKNIKGNTKK